MPRRKRVLKRPPVLADKNFGSVIVSRLTNRIMQHGKKTIAAKIVNTALMSASEELQVAPIEVLETALENVKPQIEVKSMRVGGASMQVPVEPYPARATRLGLTWIKAAAKNKKGKGMSRALSQVLIESFKGEGEAVAKKEAVHRTASGNRANAHFGMRKKK